MRVDMKNGGAMAHKAIMAVQRCNKEWAPPTRTRTMPDGRTTSSPIEIQQELGNFWTDKRLQEESTKALLGIIQGKVS